MRTQTRLTPAQRLTTRSSFALGAVSLMALSLMVIGLLHMRQQQQTWSQRYAPAWSSALAEAQSSGKHCLVRFYTDYCYPCQAWDEALHRDGQLFELLDAHFVLYQIDAWNTYNGGRELAKRYGITRYPTLLLTDAQGKEIARFEGLEPPVTLRHALKAKVGSEGQALPPEAAPTPRTAAFGLRIGETSHYEAARSLASQEALGWNRGVFIQPEGKSYALILGTFHSRDEANITRRFLHLWENRKSKVVSLEATGTAYGF